MVGKPVRCPACRQVFALQLARPQGAGVKTGAGQPVGVGEASGWARPGVAATSSRAPSPPRAAVAPPAVCPTCQAVLPLAAVACLDCGYLLQGEPGSAEPEGTPHLCPNPVCGVASPAGERFCQRCSTPLPTAPGTLLHGRFRIERLLAMGGFGAVYLASDTRMGNRPVAVKDMICADPGEFALRLNFFRREAEILRSLDRLPIVPRVHDFIEQGQTALLVLEYIRGQDLLKVMEANAHRPFPIPLVVEWGQSICDVLAHMHGRQPPLVHRDLKPDNIMLLEDQRSIKLIDFGTARDIGRSSKTRVAAKTRVYTEGYAPPEQIVGKPEVRSDLFALAGTLYHLATGRPPEGFYTARELEAQLASPNGSLPADQRWFFELLQINLAEDANDRYFSAREIRADLERRRVTREASCPRCQAVNPVRQPYCGACAEPLTDPAPPCGQCGGLNRMGSRCCIHCGNRLR
jgi:hypothetical protein